MLTFEQACARLLGLASRPKATERVRLDDAVGRVLAEDVTTPTELPPFTYSAMDGYAVRASDVTPSVTMPVDGESRTGALPPKLTPMTAMRIFTGAELPEGADAVVMQEHARRDGANVTFEAPVKPSQHVRERGSDAPRGARLLTRGTRLGPAHLALAAALDRSTLEVTRRPRVAVVATGDELRPPGSAPRKGTIPESNTVAIRAMAVHAGGACHVYPRVSDDRVEAERVFRELLGECDVLVTIGGVSVGDHDVVRPALESIGVVFDFWRVAIKPGKPIAVGTLRRDGHEVIALGIPGNPSSAMVTFALFGVPLIRALQGDSTPLAEPIRARVGAKVRHTPGRLEFARATLEFGSRGPIAHVLDNQASGAVTSMARANALVCIPADSGDVEEGAELDVFLLSDRSL